VCVAAHVTRLIDYTHTPTSIHEGVAVYVALYVAVCVAVHMTRLIDYTHTPTSIHKGGHKSRFD